MRLCTNSGVVGPSNEEMQQTKPAFLLDCAGFAADLRCSTDSDQACFATAGSLVPLDERRNKQGLMLSYDNGRPALRTSHASTRQAPPASAVVATAGSPLPRFGVGSTSTAQLHRDAGWTREEGCPLTDEPRATRAASVGRLSNEALQQTRRSLDSGLAAERRC
jgi:hypothetical protein